MNNPNIFAIILYIVLFFYFNYAKIRKINLNSNYFI